MIKFNHLLISALFVLSTSCSEKKSIPTVNLSIDTILNSYSDSSFFNDIRSITYYQNKYYISDYKRDQIAVLNDSLKIMDLIGQKGEGPGEFLGLSHISVCYDTIIAYNDSKRAIEIFHDAKHENSIRLPLAAPMKPNYKFFYNYRNLIYGQSNSNSGICIYNTIDNSFSFFGTLELKSTEKETKIKNSRHILGYKNKIVSVSDYKHIVEIYNDNMALETTYDYSSIPLAKKRLDFIKNQKETANSYYNILSDAGIYNEHLYLLLYSNTNDKVTCNSILQLDISENNLIPIRIMKLETEGFFGAFCVGDNYVLTFDRKNGILIRYNLN